MAANQEEIKRRIGSIDTIKKITKAMELVSTAKLRKIKHKLTKIETFYKQSYDLFAQIFSKAEKFDQKVNDLGYLEQPNVEKENSVYIVITSSLGFCGSFNSAVYKTLAATIDKKNDYVITIGKKGYNYFKNRDYKILEKFNDFSDDVEYEETKMITEKVMDAFFKEDLKITHVYLLYTNFVNSLTYIPKVFQLLPISKEYVGSFKTKINNDEATAITEYEPDPVFIFNQIIPFYITSVLFGALIESKVSEQASRRTSMESATKSAKDLIDNLLIEFNRLRQSTITNEISEIVAGADSQ